MKSKATIFEFASYKFEPEQKRIFFNYLVRFKNGDKIPFTETVILPKAPNLSEFPPALLNKILQNIHLALGISYYKLHCAKKFRLNHSLSQKEADFWSAFYKKGLGEFLFRNKLSPNLVPKFPFKNKENSKNFRLQRTRKFLVGLGGGKDSIVSAELLKKYGTDFSVFFVQTQSESPLIDRLIEKIGKESIKIKRLLDEKLFDSQADYYQGHIPISGIYAFLGLLSATVYGYSYVVVSNEFSSNFGNTRYKGQVVNHQWSKSSEFENMFQNYVKEFISPDLFYFSLLRPFYEIRIAELFSKYKEYFPYFSSCNQNFKISRPRLAEAQQSVGGWCGQCAKCIFSFLLFSPFLSKQELESIFGSNYFQHADILVILRDILGFGKMKPFDCVGTFDEAKTAFYLARQKFRDDLAGEIFLPKIDPDDNRYFLYNKKITFKIYFKNKKNPQGLVDKVFRAQPSSVPDHIKFLGMKNAYILGYGKEGKITEEYLKQEFPGLQIGIGDIKTDSDYLDKQKNYDIAIRSPGIQKEKIKIPYTTATNMFFSYIRQMIPGVKIIGVTGSKGKSTTASLICHILRKAGKDVKFLGNIGSPMLEAVLKVEIKNDTIVILELSSYQLDDIRFSPDIAVITTLFPEHMDYHYNIKDYYSAKKNIIKYQQKGDIFVFNSKNRKVASWAKTAKAKTVPFAKTIPVDDSEIKLLGKHNRDNIRAAIAVAQSLTIPEEIIKKSIKTFVGLPHRLQFIGQYSDIKFFDDAISTTPESTISAIKSLPKIGTIFLGGQDRGYKFSELERIIKKHKIKNIVLFPESGKRIFRKGRKGLNVLETSSMEEAVKFAYQYTPSDQICLLSCASPSYSLWKNFEEKGDQFQLLVKKLAP